MHVDNLSRHGKELFPLIEFDEEEELVWEIRKHPFGLFIIYFTGTTITFIILALLVVGPLAFSSDFLGLGINLGVLRPILIMVGFLLTLLSLVSTLIGAFLYTSDVVLVTSEKIAQQLHHSLFNKKISQLSIGDIQDVTVTKKGIFPTLFNYGTLVIETAGEQQNYTFTYTPNPYEASKAIVGAHEIDLRKHGN
jgi:hypothetical protein